MCGVIGYIHEVERPEIGPIAGRLLESLQYRGYDSTGAAIQEGDEVTLRKGVGAPSTLIHSLGIVELSGRVFCGQVRWATFGAVDDANAQPHVVRCKTFLYGAHNGNVNNTDEVKAWLTSEGHQVISDNDGEMVVHTVEHYFAEALDAGVERLPALRSAVVKASERLRGSFAAVVVDPVTKTMCTIKRGSSLYFGVGEDEGGKFMLASSDLSSVLQFTHQLVPLASGEFVIYGADHFEVRALDGSPEGRVCERAPSRSKLRSQDTGLSESFDTFMAQEIAAQPETCADVLRMLSGGSDAAKAYAAAKVDAVAIRTLLARIDQSTSSAALKDDVATAAVALPALAKIGAAHPGASQHGEDGAHHSSESALFAELSVMMPEHVNTLRGIDAALEYEESHALNDALDRVCELFDGASNTNGRIYLVCCGTSYHAARAGALFFSELAGLEVLPLLPGEFRGQYTDMLRPTDVFVAISQSGETKDLIDVLDQSRETHALPCVAFVNNLNSTLAQERADVVVPLRCGPEIAVPATKSFINQLALLYGLAHRLGVARKRGIGPHADLPALLTNALAMTQAAVNAAADELYLAPSMHLLATRLSAVAMEGALKIREVVLNHTEGFEGSEFKHGRNTILGFNTIFGPAGVEALLERVAQDVDAGASGDTVRAALGTHMDALYEDYPLVFVTGPAERDVDLTISQIHTHKIRGAKVIVVAEENERLRAAASGVPSGQQDYRHVYIALPTTGDTTQTVFTATVALQLLALAMSNKKRAYLDALGVPEHGVHPDVPKNVSKSITVD